MFVFSCCLFLFLFVFCYYCRYKFLTFKFNFIILIHFSFPLCLSFEACDDFYRSYVFLFMKKTLWEMNFFFYFIKMSVFIKGNPTKPGLLSTKKLFIIILNIFFLCYITLLIPTVCVKIPSINISFFSLSLTGLLNRSN